MEDIAAKLQEVADRSLRNEGCIKKLESEHQALTELAISVKELATDQVNMKDDIAEIKTRPTSRPSRSSPRGGGTALWISCWPRSSAHSSRGC